MVCLADFRETETAVEPYRARVGGAFVDFADENTTTAGKTFKQRAVKGVADPLAPKAFVDADQFCVGKI